MKYGNNYLAFNKQVKSLTCSSMCEYSRILDLVSEYNAKHRKWIYRVTVECIMSSVAR